MWLQACDATCARRLLVDDDYVTSVTYIATPLDRDYGSIHISLYKLQRDHTHFES